MPEQPIFTAVNETEFQDQMANLLCRTAQQGAGRDQLRRGQVHHDQQG